jgi:hypothetical protein
MFNQFISELRSNLRWISNEFRGDQAPGINRLVAVYQDLPKHVHRFDSAVNLETFHDEQGFVFAYRVDCLCGEFRIYDLPEEASQ